MESPLRHALRISPSRCYDMGNKKGQFGFICQMRSEFIIRGRREGPDPVVEETETGKSRKSSLQISWNRISKMSKIRLLKIFPLLLFCIFMLLWTVQEFKSWLSATVQQIVKQGEILCSKGKCDTSKNKSGTLLGNNSSCLFDPDLLICWNSSLFLGKVCS